MIQENRWSFANIDCIPFPLSPMSSSSLFWYKVNKSAGRVCSCGLYDDVCASCTRRMKKKQEQKAINTIITAQTAIFLLFLFLSF